PPSSAAMLAARSFEWDRHLAELVVPPPRGFSVE
ncbi:MAG: hypothetical protein H6Q87_1436, partial [candidate division NC10 bacterium]|nr:hypothetical protein [candidate division NC10 bacterium]